MKLIQEIETQIWRRQLFKSDDGKETWYGHFKSQNHPVNKKALKLKQQMEEA